MPFLLILLALLLVPTTNAEAFGRGDDDPPRLAVFLVIDQFRADFLEQHADEWQGGIARLLEHGQVFTQATHDHSPTNTGPGHVTLSSGVFPARHGAVDNAWFEGGERVVCSQDPNATLLGRRESTPASPHQFFRPMLADWIKEEWPESRVYSLGWKDRVGTAMGGQYPDMAYWMGDCEWVSSNWYGKELPAWLQAYNATEPVHALAGQQWEQLDAARVARMAPRADDYMGESPSSGRAFPHPLGEATDSRFKRKVSNTPMQDGLTLEFARKLILEEKLGQDDVPDYLGLGLAATDYIGHTYGPYSREMADNLLRLDQELGAFFSFLDEEVGKDRWVLAFSADHGVAAMPEYSAEQGMDAERVLGNRYHAILDSIDALVREPLGREKKLYQFKYHGTIWLDTEGEDRCEVEQAFATELAKLPFLLEVLTECELLEVDENSPLRHQMLARGVVPGRSAHLFPVAKPGWLIDTWDTGTTHGTLHAYDRQVPLIFLGRGVDAGRVEMPVSTVDVAPTLASRIGLVPPAGLDGKVLPQR